MMNSTQVAASRAITVPFRGVDLYVVEHNGQPYTPMKPIVEGMGLDWKSQHRKVAANQGRWGMAIITMPLQGVFVSEAPASATVGDLHGQVDHAGLSHHHGDAGQRRALTCIPVRKVAAWLATIEPGKIKNLKVRARVIQFQDECDDALWQYWNDGIAINPRALYSVNPGDVLNKEEADTLRQMIEGMAKKLSADAKVQGRFIMQAWSKLKSHFKVGYREIPRLELTEAISIIDRHAVEWEVVDEAPGSQALNDERIKLAMESANALAAQVQRHVFEQLIDAGACAGGRWMLRLGVSAQGRYSPLLKEVPPEDYVLPMEQFHDAIDSRVVVSDAVLARIAASCTRRLAHRLSTG